MLGLIRSISGVLMALSHAAPPLRKTKTAVKAVIWARMANVKIIQVTVADHHLPNSGEAAYSCALTNRLDTCTVVSIRRPMLSMEG